LPSIKNIIYNEKGAVAIANNFEIKPAHFHSKVGENCTLLSTTPDSIDQSLTMLKELHADMRDLLQSSMLL
jgi:hypothetical protein